EFFRFFGNDVIYSIKRTVHEKDFPRLEGCVASAVCGEALRTVVRMKGVDTDFRWMLATVKMLSDTSAEPLYSITLSDIFSLEALAYSRERRIAEYRHVFSMTSDLAFEYSFETKLIRIYMFDCFREITITRVSLSQWRENALDSGYISSRYIDTFKRLCSSIESGVYRFDCEFEASLLTGGKTREMYLFRGLTRYDDPEHKKVTGIISVINSRNKTKDLNITIESNRDSISELLSKRAITSFSNEILNAKPNYNVNIILLDIDNFSQINSSYGHLFGDEVIHTVAGIIKNEIGSRGIAGRTGGGNFQIIVENTRDETDLRGILRAIRTKTEWAFADRFDNFRVTCSMGVSTYPVDSRSYDELFMQADKALYLAKEKGQNRYVIYDINKHGPVEKDLENKIVFLSSKKDVSEKLAFIGDLADMLVLGKIPDIMVLLEQIRSIFAIDDVCVFAGNELSLMISCGNAAAKNALYILENNYTDRFSGDSIFVIDNVNELEGRDDNAFEIMTSQHIGGAVQYLITEDSMIKGLISFCYIDRFKKWSVMDTNYLTIIARTISAILRKHTYI
ncbi:MAG: GGDEF domain-containing protein, partial [Ruminococcus sp.]|nr:GGDEF domain-containing protein [Ruminococcus sp.]